VIDEAGTVPKRQMEQALKLAEQAGPRVVLLGDTGQTKAIEAGRPFHQLQASGMATSAMAEIQRQKDPVLREAVSLAAHACAVLKEGKLAVSARHLYEIVRAARARGQPPACRTRSDHLRCRQAGAALAHRVVVGSPREGPDQPFSSGIRRESLRRDPRPPPAPGERHDGREAHPLIHTDLLKELSPKSRKHLRAYLFNAFEVARKRGGPWEGRANPIEEVDPVKVAKVPRSILQATEMEPVLTQLEAEWRGPVAVGLYAGLREGEIFGLRKEDVDLTHVLLMVSRSWDAPRTKDGKALPVPIAPPLRPYLDEALKSPGRLLFPDERGSMRPRSLRLGKPLRRAIAAAGLVVGYEHRCRAWRCGWREKQPSPTPPKKCPRCGRRTTWAKALPRHVWFHDTRHSFGTALVRTAGLAIAQKGLRHSDVRLTADTYGHLDIEDLARGVLGAFPDRSATSPPAGETSTHPARPDGSAG
jgi:integrase